MYPNLIQNETNAVTIRKEYGGLPLVIIYDDRGMYVSKSKWQLTESTKTENGVTVEYLTIKFNDMLFKGTIFQFDRGSTSYFSVVQQDLNDRVLYALSNGQTLTFLSPDIVQHLVVSLYDGNTDQLIRTATMPVNLTTGALTPWAHKKVAVKGERWYVHTVNLADLVSSDYDEQLVKLRFSDKITFLLNANHMSTNPTMIIQDQVCETRELNLFRNVVIVTDTCNVFPPIAALTNN